MGKIKINLNSIKTSGDSSVQTNNADNKDTIKEANISQVDVNSSPKENKEDLIESNEITTPISETVENKEIISEEINSPSIKSNVKLNLSSIKETNNKTIEEETPKVEEKKEEQPIKHIGLSLNKKEDVIDDDKTDELNAENTKEDTVDDDKTDDIIKKKKGLFENYESTFKKDKTNILEHIKKLKEMPKTNIVFLTILIALTIAGIGFLFHSNPETHNLNNYKTSLIDTYNALSTDETNNNNEPKKDIVNKGGYKFNVDIEKINGKDVYVHDGKYYESKVELDKYIEEKIEIIKKEKVIKILKDSFSK